MIRNHGSGSGDGDGETNFWKGLWNLDCLPKAKHFLWRLSHNTLAVRKVLQRRGMKLETRCYMCGRLNEYGGRVLLNCKESIKFGGS